MAFIFENVKVGAFEYGNKVRLRSTRYPRTLKPPHTQRHSKWTRASETQIPLHTGLVEATALRELCRRQHVSNLHVPVQSTAQYNDHKSYDMDFGLGTHC